jgi:hypothetical protein
VELVAQPCTQLANCFAHHLLQTVSTSRAVHRRTLTNFKSAHNGRRHAHSRYGQALPSERRRVLVIEWSAMDTGVDLGCAFGTPRRLDCLLSGQSTSL